jgi:RNA polymerase sigma factor (sigma-70 family)
MSSLHPHSEAPLELLARVSAAMQGERDAARSLFDHYERQVVAYCVLACSGSHEAGLALAGEVLSETFAGLARLAHPADFESLLWATAARRARGRHPDPARQRVLEAYVLARTGGSAPGGETPEEREARLALVRAALEPVEDERARAVALAHYLDGKDPKQIAQAMGLPPGTVALKLARIDDRVKRELVRWAVAEATPR